MPKSQRTKVFISYSHHDDDWLKRLKVHLRPLERDYAIDIWDDTQITPGSRWKEEIKQALDAAKVAILLVSADFLASDFIATDELPPLLNAAEKEGALILPVILSPSRFERTAGIAQFQAVNPPSSPLIDMTKGEQEAVFVKIADMIETAFSKLAPLPRTIPVEHRSEPVKPTVNRILDAEFVVITQGEFAVVRRNKRYALGIGIAEIRRDLGAPEEEKTDRSTGNYLSGMTSLTYRSAGLQIARNKQGIIQSFSLSVIPRYGLNAASVVTDTGIKKGASINDIIAAHGQPYKRQDFKQDIFDLIDLYYKSGTLILDFQFDHGVYASISLVANYLPYLQK